MITRCWYSVIVGIRRRLIRHAVAATMLRRCAIVTAIAAVCQISRLLPPLLLFAAYYDAAAAGRRFSYAAAPAADYVYFRMLDADI